MENYEQEHVKTVANRNYHDAQTVVELYDAQTLQELVMDEVCPECGCEVELSKGDHTIMVKAECTGEDCFFGFCDTLKNVEKYIN